MNCCARYGALCWEQERWACTGGALVEGAIQPRPAANNLAEAGISFSNLYISCMYKSARDFPCAAFQGNYGRTCRCGVGLHCV